MTTSPPDAPVDPAPRAPDDRWRSLAALRRSSSDKKIAGVAGGISRHLDVDPIIIRVTLVVLVFFGGSGLVLYGACWLLVPMDNKTRAAFALDDRSRPGALLLAGVVATLLLLGDSLGGWEFPWPVFVGGVVVVVVMLSRSRDRNEAAPYLPYPDRPPATYPAAAPGAATAPYPSAYPAPGQHAPPLPPPAPVARAKRRGPVLFWYALALIAIAVGILVSLDVAGLDVTDSAYPAVALVTSGVLLVVGAFWGRPGGLIALGLVSAVATAGALAAGGLDVDQLEPRPVAASMLLDSYDLDVGEIVLDLTAVRDLDGLDGAAVDLDVGVGRIEVIVPDDVSVGVSTYLGAGDSSVFGTSSDSGRKSYTVDGGPDAPSVKLDVHVGLGEIDIHREGETS